MLNSAQTNGPARIISLDPLQAHQFLEALYGRFFKQFDGQAFLEVRGKREGEGLNFRRFFKNVSALVHDMGNWPPDINLWIGVAPRKSDQSGKKENCLVLTASYGDVDCGTLGHKTATKYEDKAAALSAIKGFRLRPSILVDSGGGFQPYWLLRETVALTNGNLAKMERINRGLALALGGDMAATDAARILRLPGTYNMKLPNNPRPVVIMWCEPELSYDLTELSEYGAQNTPRKESSNQSCREYEAYAQKALTDELAILSKTPAHDPGRNNQLNKSAFALGQLVGAGGLDQGSVEAALCNVALSIGLGEAETRATVKSGLEAGMREPRKLPQRKPSTGKEGGQDTDCKEQKSKQNNPKPITLNTITAKALAAKEFPPRRWAIPELITEGLTIMAGPPKTGKSWLVLNMSVAVATGGKALGKIEVEQGEALYLALEDSERRLKERLKKIIPIGELPDALHIATAGNFPPLNKGGLEALAAWLKENPKAKLIIIDTLARVKPGRSRNQNSYDHDTAIISALQKLSIDHQIALIVIHHTKKQETVDFVAEVSGTFGLTGAADCVAVLSRRGRGQMDGTLKLTGRDIEEKELALKFDPNLGLWELLGEASQYCRSQERQDILFILNENGPQTPAQLSKILGKKGDTVRQLLFKMKEVGEVKPISGNRYEGVKKWEG